MVNYGHQGCSEDALSVFDSQCSGRKACNVNVRDLIALGVKPCTEDLRSYLEARYTCIKGTFVSYKSIAWVSFIDDGTIHKKKYHYHY